MKGIGCEEMAWNEYEGPWVGKGVLEVSEKFRVGMEVWDGYRGSGVGEEGLEQVWRF